MLPYATIHLHCMGSLDKTTNRFRDFTRGFLQCLSTLDDLTLSNLPRVLQQVLHAVVKLGLNPGIPWPRQASESTLPLGSRVAAVPDYNNDPIFLWKCFLQICLSLLANWPSGPSSGYFIITQKM